MELLHPHCAGLDVQKETVVACVRHLVDSKVATAVKTFKTTTQERMELSDWLATQAVTHIAMEATGVYWKPCGTFSPMATSSWCWPTRRT